MHTNTHTHTHTSDMRLHTQIVNTKKHLHRRTYTKKTRTFMYLHMKKHTHLYRNTHQTNKCTHIQQILCMPGLEKQTETCSQEVMQMIQKKITFE